MNAAASSVALFLFLGSAPYLAGDHVGEPGASPSVLEIVIEGDRKPCGCRAMGTETSNVTITNCCTPPPFFYVTTPDLEHGSCGTQMTVEGVTRCIDSGGSCKAKVRCELRWPTSSSSTCSQGALTGPEIGSGTSPCQPAAPGGSPNPFVEWTMSSKCKVVGPTTDPANQGDELQPMQFWCVPCADGSQPPSPLGTLKYAPKLICGSCSSL
jgi:hypothetical protein